VGALTENWLNGFRVVDDGRTSVANYIWDTGTLAWVVQSGGGAGPAADVNVISSVAIAVTGPLTDTQLRATPVPVSLTSTTITGSVAVTGPLTDTQLRATPVPISGTVAATQSGAWSTGRTWALAKATDNVQAQIYDGTNSVGIKALNVQVVAADFGLITNSVIHGLSSAGTGSYVDARVSPAGALSVTSNTATANTRSSVAAAATDTLILAASGARLGATIFNDSSAVLYLALGTVAASTTNFTVKMVADAYYEVPFGYTGEIRGIWASATGSARVGEIT